MTLNDPIVIFALGTGMGVVSWVVRSAMVRLDRRITVLETDVDNLQKQMAAHDANKELLDRMYIELQALTKLTSRIAGHLNIS